VRTDMVSMAATSSFAEWQQQSRILDQAQIVFIVGPPKCGTTWLMTALDAHPRMVSRGECGLTSVLHPKLVEAVHTHNKHHQTCSKPFSFISDPDLLMIYRQIYDRILLQYIADKNFPTGEPLLAVIDKTPPNSQFVDLLSEVYPTSKFICCDRDVRDAAVSGWFHFSRVGLAEQKTLAEYAVFFARGFYRPYIVKARASGAKLGPSRFIEVDYAEHTSNPHATLRRLFDFIGVRASDAEVQHCVSASDFKTQSGGRTPGHEHSDSFHRKGVVGDWRNHFTPEFGDLLLRVSRTPLEDPVETWNPRTIPAHIDQYPGSRQRSVGQRVIDWAHDAISALIFPRLNQMRAKIGKAQTIAAPTNTPTAPKT
jgi:hypothetical protein